MMATTGLTTRRLLLRRFAPDDAEEVAEYAASPEWGRYLVNVPQPFTPRDAEEFVVRFASPETSGATVMFAIVLDGKVIGEAYLNLDAQNQRAELGYSLSPEHWGKGLATEAARAVMDWGFQTSRLNKVFATCDPRNEPSRRVLERLGMSLEGQLRRHLLWRGEFRDVLHYGLLRGEWEKGRQRRSLEPAVQGKFV